MPSDAVPGDVTIVVRTERRRRGWSIRTAAVHGHVSNQTWSVFERTGQVTDRMHAAIMTAFDWPSNWAEHTPVSQPHDELAVLRGRVAELEQQVGFLLALAEKDAEKDVARERHEPRGATAHEP